MKWASRGTPNRHCVAAASLSFLALSGGMEIYMLHLRKGEGGEGKERNGGSAAERPRLNKRRVARHFLPSMLRRVALRRPAPPCAPRRLVSTPTGPSSAAAPAPESKAMFIGGIIVFGGIVSAIVIT